MNMAVKMTAAYFDSKELSYTISEDGQAIATGFGLQNVDRVKILIVFDEGDHTVGLRALGIAKFPESKKDEMFPLVNTLNQEFRWIKFVVDEEDLVINAEDDAVIQLDSCGEEVFELCLHFAAIVDNAYPIIMKSLFA